jgi:hypothetical protein
LTAGCWRGPCTRAACVTSHTHTHPAAPPAAPPAAHRAPGGRHCPLVALSHLGVAATPAAAAGAASKRLQGSTTSCRCAGHSGGAGCNAVCSPAAAAATHMDSRLLRALHSAGSVPSSALLQRSLPMWWRRVCGVSERASAAARRATTSGHTALDTSQLLI